jgi:hypothetical protein
MPLYLSTSSDQLQVVTMSETKWRIVVNFTLLMKEKTLVTVFPKLHKYSFYEKKPLKLLKDILHRKYSKWDYKMVIKNCVAIAADMVKFMVLKNLDL